MAHHDGRRLRAQRAGDRQDVLDHRHAGDPMQHLGPRRFHAGPLTRREDHDTDVRHLGPWALVLGPSSALGPWSFLVLGRPWSLGPRAENQRPRPKTTKAEGLSNYLLSRGA